MPPGTCYGRTDLALADPASVAPLAAAVRVTSATVWSSPARRCRAVAEALGPHRIDARLLELDFGAWESVAWDDIARTDVDAWAADPWHNAPPRGETGRGLAARVTEFAAELGRGDHVVITHGGPLKVLTAVLRGAPVDLMAPPPPLGSITRIG